MKRKITHIILTSLLAIMLAGCGDKDAANQTQPVDGPPAETGVSTEAPPGTAGPSTGEPYEETASPTGEPYEETASPTGEPYEETASPTGEPPDETASPTEGSPEETAPLTQTPAPTAAPTPVGVTRPTASPTPAATPAPTAAPTPAPTAAPTPAATPAPTQPPSPPPVSVSVSVPYPSAPGTAVARSGSALVDYSNAGDGYVMVKWTGEAVKIAVQVKGPNNAEKYTYYLRTDGNYDVLPLSDGSGDYQIAVLKNVSGTKYAQVLSTSVSVRLTDSLAPFLRPNQYVNYSSGSEAVRKAQELTAGAADNLSKVGAVYNWVVTNLSYDYNKAATVQSGYLPDVDQVMRERKGICFDYASLMSAMLRSQGVPVKLVVGYTATGEYHAWINVWSETSGWIDSVIYFNGGSWKLMDPTFASTGNQSSTIMEYIGNTANYQERFTY